MRRNEKVNRARGEGEGSLVEGDCVLLVTINGVVMSPFRKRHT